jgi:sulfate adenylyltransferase subunit 2
MSQTKPYRVSHLDALEAESIFVMREVMAEFERPVMLFSGGKDSIVMLRLAEKAFAPARIPFPVMHVDTGHNFPEVLDYRDTGWPRSGSTWWSPACRRRSTPGWCASCRTARATGSRRRCCSTPSRSTTSTRCSAAPAATRRRRAPRSGCSASATSFGQWDPKNQRPELWALYNGRHHPGESIRVFPLSNWTELDVWHYIAREQIPLPSIYYAHDREVVERGGMFYAVNEFIKLRDGESSEVRKVRYRTGRRRVADRRRALRRRHRWRR